MQPLREIRARSCRAKPYRFLTFREGSTGWVTRTRVRYLLTLSCGHQFDLAKTKAGKVGTRKRCPDCPPLPEKDFKSPGN